MLYGRTNELQTLEDMYYGDTNALTVLYGRSGIGKTALLKEFCKEKGHIYYIAQQASEEEQFELIKQQFAKQLPLFAEEIQEKQDYMSLFPLLRHTKGETKVLIIEDFSNIVKNKKSFINSLTALVDGELMEEKVLIICTSASISWIENSLVSAIGSNATAVKAFLKIKELSFVDTVRMFPRYSVAECLHLFAVTGGVPGYMVRFSDEITLKENICQEILTPGSYLHEEGHNYVKEELRETAIYNTILYRIANGENKLNELHESTGFGRDKISVYLKNLIEREIVEKVFSYDSEGNEYTRKGLYKIKANMVEFWFKYIYAHISELTMTEPDIFYDKYIKDTMETFAADTFAKVGMEYIELMDIAGQLPVTVERKGRWWGKTGNIDVIACDTANRYVVGKCNWVSEMFTFDLFEELMYNVSLANIGKDYIYLFSKGTFDKELTDFAKENENIFLVGMDDL